MYLYDASGAPIGMQYRETTMGKGEFYTFWFEKNLQGDIVGVYNASGVKVRSYSYDAWGNVTETVHSDVGSNYYARYNPFKYRGYYHDSETGFYYLQSRYYDPAMGRFLNADGYVSTGSGMGHCTRREVTMKPQKIRKRKKWLFPVLIIGSILTILLIIGITWWHLPSEYDFCTIRYDCVLIHGTEMERDKNGYSEAWYNETLLRYVNIVLKILPYQKTQDVPTDAEIVEFSFNNYERGTVKSICVAYDYYLKDVYALKDGKWYYIGENIFLNRLIADFLIWCDQSFTSPSIWEWRGQSTVSDSEFYTGDWSAPRFRYHLHWEPVRRFHDERYYYRNSEFQNTAPACIESGCDALRLASKELGYQDAVGVCFYDETCGYWMVELYDNTVDKEQYAAEEVFLFETTRTVIMNDQGITLEIYNALTSLYPFQNGYVYHLSDGVVTKLF